MAGLPLIGLAIAGIMSAANVLTDVARKKAVEERALIPATLWCKIFAALVFTVALGVRIAGGSVPEIRDGGALFGIAGLHLSPGATFAIYLLLDVVLVSAANLLYFMALQVSPMSLCIPFLAFTPVFLIPSGFVMLGELPAPMKLLGVCLIILGSFAMHRRLVEESWLAPVRAVVQQRGSRYMLLVALIFSVTNPLEKKLVLMSDIFTQAFAFGTGLVIALVILSFIRREDMMAPVRQKPGWVAAAGIGDGLGLLLQLAAYRYIDVVIAISIKRAGIVLSVFCGWLFFRERGITDKVIGASAMFAGVLILYLPLNLGEAAGITVITLAAMCVALYAARPKPAAEAAKGGGAGAGR
jgi:drug/metabolite transporter (DMT)-like permease